MKYTKLFILIFGLFFFSACSLFNNNEQEGNLDLSNLNTQETTDDSMPNETEEEIEKEDMANISTEDFSTLIMNSADTLVATLVDVSGGNSTGMGYILRQSEQLEDGTTKDALYHKVVANLPDPNGENKYEGWLVKQEPELMFFSTGVMEKNEDGEYILNYSTDKLYEDYNFVVITEETVVDETPETHIIEAVAI